MTSTPSTVPAFNLDAFLPYKMLMVTSWITQLSQKRYATELGITIAEARVISVIASFGAASSYEIAERTRMDRPKTHRATKQLVLTGILSREINQTDNRLIVLQLTEAGVALAARLIPIMHEIAATTFDVVSPEVRGELARITDLLIASHDMSRVRL